MGITAEREESGQAERETAQKMSTTLHRPSLTCGDPWSTSPTPLGTAESKSKRDGNHCAAGSSHLAGMSQQCP